MFPIRQILLPHPHHPMLLGPYLLSIPLHKYLNFLSVGGPGGGGWSRWNSHTYLNPEGQDLVPYWVLSLAQHACLELETSQSSVNASLSPPPSTGLFPALPAQPTDGCCVQHRADHGNGLKTQLLSYNFSPLCIFPYPDSLVCILKLSFNWLCF